MTIELTRGQSNRLKRVERQNRARARNKGCEVEVVDFIAICEQQGWKCAETGKPLDPSIAWPHDDCISLDHEIGLTIGGSHTNDNIRAVLWAVNRDKGRSVETSKGAKTKRMAGITGQKACRDRAKANGTYRPIPSPKNPWPKGRKLQSRNDWPKGRGFGA